MFPAAKISDRLPWSTVPFMVKQTGYVNVSGLLLVYRIKFETQV